MKPVKSVISSLICIASITAGCSRSPSAPIVSVPPEVLVAPNQIVVGTTSLRLTTYLWRDFQPGTSPDTRLLAQMRIESAAGSSVPSTLKVDKAWLILGDEAWVSIPQQEGGPGVANILQFMSRGGPQWPIGALVTVVIQVRDGNNNVSLLRADPQAIAQTE